MRLRVGHKVSVAGTALPPVQDSSLVLCLVAGLNKGDLWQNTGLTTAATADGDSVQGWEDRTSYGNHALLDTNSAPLLKRAVVDGRDGVRFNGTSTSLTVAGSASLNSVVDAWSAFLRFTPRGAYGTGNTFFVAGSDDQKVLWVTWPNLTFTTVSEQQCGLSGANPMTDVSALWTYRRSSGATQVFRHNGIPRTSVVHNATLGAETCPWRLGASRFGGSWANFGQFDLEALVLYSRALSDGEVKQVETWLGL